MTDDWTLVLQWADIFAANRACNRFQGVPLLDPAHICVVGEVNRIKGIERRMGECVESAGQQEGAYFVAKYRARVEFIAAGVHIAYHTSAGFRYPERIGSERCLMDVQQ